MSMEGRKRPVGAIAVPAGRRPLDEKTVAELVESIGARGLMQPIGVRPDDTLIWGAHRLEAVRRLGWPEVECVVIDGPDLDTELMEIDENLVRADLAFSQRVTQLARRKEIYELMHPEAKWGGDRKSSTHSGYLTARPPSFSKDTEQKTGKGRGTVQRELRIGAQFKAAEIDKLRAAKVPVLDMDRLVTVAEKTPEVVAEILAAPQEELRQTMEDRLKQLGYSRSEKSLRKEPKAKVKQKRPKVLTLEGYETTIEAKMEAFLDVAHALFQIREGRFYSEDYGEFHQYLKQRWGVSFHAGRQVMCALDALAMTKERGHDDY